MPGSSHPRKYVCNYIKYTENAVCTADWNHHILHSPDPNLWSLHRLRTWRPPDLHGEPETGNPFHPCILILQQIEGNLIYPHVVGSSVGLPSIWVLAAVTIGGNLLGIIGMLIFIPLVSVLYTLFREYVYLRLKRQHIKRVTKTEVEEYTVEEINRMKELYKKEHPEKDN